MATKTSKKPVKKAAFKRPTFDLIFSSCPELVVLFDYMIENSGATEVTLNDVEDYIENMASTISQLINQFDEETTLDKLEWLEEGDCDVLG